jgi:hypothetical protein
VSTAGASDQTRQHFPSVARARAHAREEREIGVAACADCKSVIFRDRHDRWGRIPAAANGLIREPTDFRSDDLVMERDSRIFQAQDRAIDDFTLKGICAGIIAVIDFFWDRFLGTYHRVESENIR